jgi:hypothetical protein
MTIPAAAPRACRRRKLVRSQTVGAIAQVKETAV